MRTGRLQQVIMHELSEQPHSGYSLCKEITGVAGHKPSFGSIYPILEHLSKEGMVTVHKEGRKKMYTLTVKGKLEAKRQREEFTTQAGAVLEEMRLFCAITGQDPGPITKFFEQFKREGNPLGQATIPAIKLRDTLFRIAIDGRAKRNSKQLIKILDETIVKLERLK